MFQYLVDLHNWNSSKLCKSKLELQINDKVIVDEKIGSIIGVVKKIVNKKNTDDANTPHIIRKASKTDLEMFTKNAEKRKEILRVCRDETKRMKLEMKPVDACVALGRGGIVISFIADGRIDFRQLVRNLAKIFNRSINMQQIGSRDEARRLGGCGICGRVLCCKKFSGETPTISTDMARIQQVFSRGASKISGVCGRLMCCLSYEVDQYREMLKDMPEIGSRVKTKKGIGVIIEANPIGRKVRVKLEDKNNSIITVKLK